jgi:hypothetical protein
VPAYSTGEPCTAWISLHCHGSNSSAQQYVISVKSILPSFFPRSNYRSIKYPQGLVQKLLVKYVMYWRIYNQFISCTQERGWIYSTVYTSLEFASCPNCPYSTQFSDIYYFSFHLAATFSTALFWEAVVNIKGLHLHFKKWIKIIGKKVRGRKLSFCYDVRLHE